MTNLRVVFRRLARSPIFTLVAVASLALGIGANTAIFSLFDQLLLRDLPIERPEELVYLHAPGPWQGSYSSDESGGASFSYPLVRELQQEQTPFLGLAGARLERVSLSTGAEAMHGAARKVTGNYFEVLGVRPALGRLFTEEDAPRPGEGSVAVLSHDFWVTKLNQDPAVVDREIRISGRPMTIVGVAQQGFYGERIGRPPDVYTPITMAGQRLEDRRNAWITLVARLKPGVSLERATAEINIPYRAQVEKDALALRQPTDDFLKRFRARRIVLTPGRHGRGNISENTEPRFLVLGAMTLLVLIIACANVANLQLVRGAGLAGEAAVRLAMGASRGELVRRFLLESTVVAVAGGLCGLIAAHWTIRAIIAAVPPQESMGGFMTADIDGRMLGFGLALAVVSGIAFGLYPALRSSKSDLSEALKGHTGRDGSSAASAGFRKTLVTVQVGMTLLLLISSGLLLKTLVHLTRVDLGLDSDRLVTFGLMPRLSGYDQQGAERLLGTVTERLAAIPGAESVSSASVPAVGDSVNRNRFRLPDFDSAGEERKTSRINSVGAGYFRTLGIPLVAGREFNDSDNSSGPPVIMINRAFAAQFFGEENPLGRHIQMGEKPPRQIVGIVANSSYSSVRDDEPAVMYRPLPQQERLYMMHFYIRTATAPESLIPDIRRQVAAIDSGLPLLEVKTMRTQIEQNTFAERLLSFLSGSFALVAMLLAAVGLYGVLAYNLAQRRREIGVRMALGASAARVGELVVRELIWVMGIGTAVGVALAAGAGQALGGLLFGMEPWDGQTYALAVGLLWVVALGAAYLPTRRALGIDPATALRYE